MEMSRLEKEAYARGVQRFHQGCKRVPFSDIDFMESLRSAGQVSERLGAWLLGWDHANLDRVPCWSGNMDTDELYELLQGYTKECPEVEEDDDDPAQDNWWDETDLGYGG